MLGVEKIPDTNIAKNFGHRYILVCAAEAFYPGLSLWNAECQRRGQERTAGRGGEAEAGGALLAQRISAGPSP